MCDKAGLEVAKGEKPRTEWAAKRGSVNFNMVVESIEFYDQPRCAVLPY